MNPQLPASSTSTPGTLTRRTWLIALAVAMAACLVRVIFATQRGFWLDEYFTLNAAKMNIQDMIQNRLGAGHSPLYFFYARLGLLFGSSERALRLTSALATGAAVLLMTGLAGELRLGRCLPTLWLLAIVQPYWISVGKEYRYTMPLIALAIGAAWVAVRYAERSSFRRGAALALAIGLLLWTHGSTPFFVLGLLAFMAWDGLYSEIGRPWRQRVRTLGRRVAPVLAGIGLGAPFFYLVRNHKSETQDQVAHLRDILQNMVDVVFGDSKLWFNFLNWDDHMFLLFGLESVVLLAAVWLAWRELRRQHNPRAWRLLGCTLCSVPLMMYLFCKFGKNFQGPVRYLASFTIPAVICLAVAAHATVLPRWQKGLYWAALLTVLAFQSSAMALDRGDRHRDAINWLKNNHTAKEPILLAVTSMNNLALKFYGFNPDGLTFGGFERNDPAAKVEARIQEKLLKDFKGSRRLLYIRYHSQAKVPEAIENLTKKGFFAGSRKWFIGNRRLIVGAAVRNKADIPWLNALPDPDLEWGPAQANP